MTTMEYFSKRLQILMDEQSLTLVDLQKRTGIGKSTLDRWRKNEREAKVGDIPKLCQELQVSSDWLLGIQEVRTPNPTIQAINEYTGLSEKSIENLNTLRLEPLRKYLDIIDKLISRLFEDNDLIVPLFQKLIDLTTWSQTVKAQLNQPMVSDRRFAHRQLTNTFYALKDIISTLLEMEYNEPTKLINSGREILYGDYVDYVLSLYSLTERKEDEPNGNDQ